MDKLRQRYRVKEQIGKGAFANVYAGFDREEGKDVAIKRVLHKPGSPGVDWSALREVKLLLEIHHPNVVRLVGVFAQNQHINMVLEYCPLDLEKIIKSESTLIRDGDIKAYIQMALKGIKACHDNWILHRDLKPENLLIGVDRQLKVADFGLARVIGQEKPNLTDEVVTLPYRSPELLFGARVYSGAVDIWSIGCIFAELLVREVVFPGVDTLDQLGKIFYTMGTPTETDWEGVESLPKFVRYDPCKRRPLNERFRAADEDTLDIIGKMLTLDPNKRPSAAEALEHPYFTNGIKPTLIYDLPFNIENEEGRQAKKVRV
mmetsp:Transcript_7575/g.8702  ORF Transcript_7575/g.8702 Transcript_7575/m.8702 type:complete len:318 (+) Transcript_7575:153-1106(+)